MATAANRQVPEWVPVGATRDCLESDGNILGHIKNKIGDLTMCMVDLTDDGHVRFPQFNGDGDGNTISVNLGSRSYISQIDAKVV